MKDDVTMHRLLLCVTSLMVLLSLVAIERFRNLDTQISGYNYENIDNRITKDNLLIIARAGRRAAQFDLSIEINRKVIWGTLITKDELIGESRAIFGCAKRTYLPTERVSLIAQIVDSKLRNALPSLYGDGPIERGCDEFGGPFFYETPEGKFKLLVALVSWLIRFTVAMVGIPAAIAMFLVARVRA